MADNQRQNSDRATALVENEGKVLVIHRLNEGREYYVLPGGSIGEGETAEQAAERELEEETSILGKIGEKILDFTDSRNRKHKVYKVRYISGDPKLENTSEEFTRSSTANQYKPMWIHPQDLANKDVWPLEVKKYLAEHY